MKKIQAVAVSLLFLILITTSIALSQGAWVWVWEVNTVSPTPIGPQVGGAADSPDNPDTKWAVTEDGVLQFIAKDHDPKCRQFPGYVQVEETPYPIPTSPPQPGKDCAVTVNNLFHSRLFAVSQGSEVWGEQGSSGSFVFNFATNTPMPTATATTTPTATFTPAPTATSTATATATPGETAEPPATDEPPTAQCLGVLAERQEDGSYLIWVQAVNASGYTFFDGEGYLYFDEQPIQMGELTAGVMYTVKVGDDDIGCEFQLEPTGLPTEEQPVQRNFKVSIPFLSN